MVKTTITYGELAKRLDSIYLFNKAPELDEYLYDEVVNGSLEMPCYEHESLTDDCDRDYQEVYQYYLISKSDADYLGRISDELIFYSDVLDEYIWGVTHFGTSWDYVDLEIEEA